jgi:ankyrin repeat protein
VQGHLEVVKALIAVGGAVLILTTQEDGISCLSMACARGHLNIAKALIEAGGEALLLKTDRVHGYSCLHVACHHGHVPIVTHLLSLPSCAGLFSLRDRFGNTALQLAVAVGKADVAEAMRAVSGRHGA